MAKPVLLDTDVLVDFLRGHPQAVSWVQAHSHRIILSRYLRNSEPSTGGFFRLAPEKASGA